MSKRPSDDSSQNKDKDLDSKKPRTNANSFQSISYNENLHMSPKIKNSEVKIADLEDEEDEEISSINRPQSTIMPKSKISANLLTANNAKPNNVVEIDSVPNFFKDFSKSNGKISFNYNSLSKNTSDNSR